MINKIMLAMLMAAAAFGASAGNPEKLFDEFKKVENTEYVRVRRAFLWAFRATGMLKDVPAVGNITGIKVLNFDQALHLTRRIGSTADSLRRRKDGRKCSARATTTAASYACSRGPTERSFTICISSPPSPARPRL